MRFIMLWVHGEPLQRVRSYYVGDDEPEQNGDNHGPAQAILRQERSYMGWTVLQVCARSEYLLSDERLVGRQEDEGVPLRVGRSRDLLRPRAPLCFGEQQHFGSELARHDRMRHVLA